MIGATISHYKITEKLGEGGMGVVYKAEDTKLKRKVAIKFLAPHLVRDEEGRKRFEREAMAAAALDHPNVCTVYEIDEADGRTFIVMAFLEGQPLSERIQEGPLKLTEALSIAIQMAEGLEAAHEKGITHRDIKPDNVMVDAKGRAIIMDFGLARLTEASRLTRADQTMGTVAYMSPEQAQGMEVDNRTDVWALGVVLYEMVRGERPFQGEYDQALLFEVVHQEPEPLTGVRAGVPMELEFIVGKCLAKDPANRYGDADEIAKDLRTLAEKLKSGRSMVLQATDAAATGTATLPVEQSASPAEAVVTRPSSPRVLQVLLGLTALALLVSLFVHFTEAPPETALRRFSFAPSRLDTSNTRAGVAVSPNGRHIAFATEGFNGLLRVQDLDQDEPRELAGTEGASLPFWSPDSKFIAFAANGELRRISVHGGAVGRVCSLPGRDFYGATWSSSGESIVFSSSGGSSLGSLFEVAAQGDVPKELVVPGDVDDMAIAASRPHFLPGPGRVLLFTAGSATASKMYVRDLDTGRTENLGPGDRPVYSAATGHVIYQEQRNSYDLWARSLSSRTLGFTGAAFPIRQNARQPSLAEDGTLVYLDGGSEAALPLVWLDRSGAKVADTGVSFRNSTNPHPRISPDGGRVAFIDDQRVWVQDLSRGSRVRLGEDAGSSILAAWAPDGEQVAFTSTHVAEPGIFMTSADGSGETVVVQDGPMAEAVTDWSLDGHRLVYTLLTTDSGADIRYVERQDDGSWEDHSFLQTPSTEFWGRISPNGRYLAYLSDESGTIEIYVQPFPEGSGRTLVSTNGGFGVSWGRDGTELFYIEDGEQMVSVEVSTEDAFSVGETKRLFRYRFRQGSFDAPPYDVSPDGRRFLVRGTAPESGAASMPKIRVVQNWYEEFREREQDRKGPK